MSSSSSSSLWPWRATCGLRRAGRSKYWISAEEQRERQEIGGEEKLRITLDRKRCDLDQEEEEDDDDDDIDNKHHVRQLDRRMLPLSLIQIRIQIPTLTLTLTLSPNPSQSQSRGLFRKAAPL